MFTSQNIPLHAFNPLALFSMGFFGAAHGEGGGAKRPPFLKSVTHILQ